MTTVKGPAYAKVNLTLHVTGQREDGYHLLDSLVVFTELADVITVNVAPEGLSLTVTGPFSPGVPTNEKNLALQAAALLGFVRGATLGAQITLDKHLPHAAGLGSASADAAAVLRMLPEVWNVPPFPPDAPEVLTLGADVPVCTHAPAPAIMQGIGEIVRPAPRLPRCAMVLVNPRVEVPTGQVFAALPNKENPPMEPMPDGADFEKFCAWLARQRNDLQPPAIKIAPEVEAALTKLRRMPAVKWAGMSGSGATCVALVKDMGAARQVARAIQVQEMGWWVVPAPVLS